MNITDMQADLYDVRRCFDAATFIQTCARAKREIARLLDALEYEEAAALCKDLHDTFHRFEPMGKIAMAEAIKIFPFNRQCTLKHLGRHGPEVDEIIMTTKLDIDELSTFVDGGWQKLLLWARINEDRQLIERIVLQVVRDLEANGQNSDEHLREVTFGMLTDITHFKSEPIPLGPVVDEAIASIISHGSERDRDGGFMSVLSLHGLNKTLMKMLEKECFTTFKQSRNSKANSQALLAALPSNPTPAETFWIHRSIEMPGILERILFDLEFDIDRYIETLRPPSWGLPSNLNFGTLKVFRHLLTPEHLDTGARRARAGKLINAVVDFQVKTGRRTREEIRAAFDKNEFDPSVLKLTTVLKGTILEEDLGM